MQLRHRFVRTMSASTGAIIALNHGCALVRQHWYPEFPAPFGNMVGMFMSDQLVLTVRRGNTKNMKTKHFPYRLDKRWSVLFFALGVTEKDGVTITSKGELIASFGRFRVKTTLSNIDHTVVDGPHRWYTAVGLRLSMTDDGVTFGTNHYKGLSIAFVKRIPRVIGFRKHSLLWVSVADPEGLAAAIGK